MLSLFIMLSLMPSRIDETLEQCIARYGEPINQTVGVAGQLQVLFVKEPYRILVDIKNDKVVLIYYSKDHAKEYFTATEIETLLAINKVNTTEKVRTISKTYFSRDRKLQAYHTEIDRYLIITYSWYLKEKEMAKTKKSTEGL